MPLLMSLRRAFALCRPFVAVLGLASAVVSSAALEKTVVFQSETEGYNTFRIPAIVKAPNGDLLAFAEGRKDSRSDTGNIDLLMKRSSDGGKTWGAIQVIWDDAGNTCGNPCPVIDEKTGVIWMLSTHNLGKDKESAIVDGTSDGGRTVWAFSSKDNGATWSQPLDITKTTKNPAWTWYATGPGIGIQIKHGPHAGRLVIPSDHNFRDEKTKKSVHASHAIYSDDHGATWQRGEAIHPDMNECQVVELFDNKGTLLMDMRSYRGLAQRGQSTSTDGGATWSAITHIPALVEPICQASIVRWENAGGKKPGWLLFSNPADPKNRRNLTVRASDDNGATWSRSFVLHAEKAAYSSLVVLSDTEAGCLYEIAEKRPSEKIVFARFDTKELLAK
ncbi:sialidase family protein [Oleiharenicola lentus]|uniref:sialidase family protein n=1 Tax=Oleiharenicola lentus TaxID=2508720 RepID=UPI003F67A7C1